MEKCKYCVFEDEDGVYVKGICTCPDMPAKKVCLRQIGQPCAFYTK